MALVIGLRVLRCLIVFTFFRVIKILVFVMKWRYASVIWITSQTHYSTWHLLNYPLSVLLFPSSSGFPKFKVNGTSVFICSFGTCSHLPSSRIHNCFQVPKLLTESVFQFYRFLKCRCKSCILRFIQVSIIVSRDKAARNKCARLRLSGISQRLQTVGSGLSFV